MGLLSIRLHHHFLPLTDFVTVLCGKKRSPEGEKRQKSKKKGSKSSSKNENQIVASDEDANSNKSSVSNTSEVRMESILEKGSFHGCFYNRVLPSCLWRIMGTKFNSAHRNTITNETTTSRTSALSLSSKAKEDRREVPKRRTFFES